MNVSVDTIKDWSSSQNEVYSFPPQQILTEIWPFPLITLTSVKKNLQHF